MARPKKDAPIDLGVTHALSEGLIERLTCPPGVPKAFLRDKEVTGLRVRVTANGAKSFVYEAKLRGKAISRTLGRVKVMTIPEAQAAARELERTVKTQKADPRELERQQRAAEAAALAAATAALLAAEFETAQKAEADKAASKTVGEVWAVYVAERRPQWGELHYRDHVRKAGPGGLKVARGTRGAGVTAPGPLFPLMALPLRDLDAAAVDAWAAREAKTRPTSARLAWRLLKVFLGWCAQQPAYAPLLPDKNPAKTTKAREALGKAGTKSDVLQRGQLAAWFARVRQLSNPVISAALQVMLLTGARPGEVLALRWEDVNTQWNGLTIRDKVEGERTIPLTPYVADLLASLPHANDWVFSSARFVRPINGEPAHWEDVSASGRLSDPNNAHARACVAAGLDGLTLHGLRRSFASLTEWLEVPAGVVAQIMGHKPSATAEKHYKVRPLELLALHHQRIEAWILEQAGVQFGATASKAGALQLVATAA